MMENDKVGLIKKIVTFEDMSQSQIDRMNLNNSSYATVIKFLDLVVEKIEKGVGLEQDLETNLKKMISPVDPEDTEDNEERLSPNQQINLYLGLLKYKSELSAPIISVLKEAVKVNVVNNTNGDGQSSNPFPIINQGEVYTKEEIQKAKGLLALSDKLQASEISLDEIEALIKEKKNK